MVDCALCQKKDSVGEKMSVWTAEHTGTKNYRLKGEYHKFYENLKQHVYLICDSCRKKSRIKIWISIGYIILFSLVLGNIQPRLINNAFLSILLSVGVILPLLLSIYYLIFRRITWKLKAIAVMAEKEKSNKKVKGFSVREFNKLDFPSE